MLRFSYINLGCFKVLRCFCNAIKMEEEKRKEEEKGMEDDKVAQAVMAYLKSKGYRQAELAFSVEQQSHRNDSSESSDGPVDPSIANPILFYSR